MNTTKMEKLERLGVLKIKQKPNFSHPHTIDEYDLIVQSVTTRLNNIQTILSDRLNSLQIRMLGITITTLTEIYQHYFNISAYRQDLNTDQTFRKAFRELNSYNVRYLEKDPSKKKEMDEIIDSLKNDYLQQMEFITTITDKLVEEKMDPFTKTFTMAHSSAYE